MRVGTVRTESWVRREGFETPGGVCRPSDHLMDHLYGERLDVDTCTVNGSNELKQAWRGIW